MDSNNLISVIIPAYNSERYVEETIRSVAAQNYSDLEIIVMDDCSNDSTVDIIKRLQIDIPYLNYYKLDHNSGVAIARNKAIEKASGRYIAFVDSDDVWLSDKLIKQMKLFSDHPGIPFTYTAIQMIDENSQILKGKRNLKEIATYNHVLRNTIIATSTVIIDRNVVPNVVMPNRRSAEDYSLWLTLLRDYGPAYGINEALTSYRISNTSISHDRKKEVKYFYAVQTEDLHINKLYAAYNTICYIVNAIKKHFL